jgi:hypothetical protein
VFDVLTEVCFDGAMRHDQRKMMAKTVFDLANLVSIALVFGPFVSS